MLDSSDDESKSTKVSESSSCSNTIKKKSLGDQNTDAENPEDYYFKDWGIKKDDLDELATKRQRETKYQSDFKFMDIPIKACRMGAYLNIKDKNTEEDSPDQNLIILSPSNGFKLKLVGNTISVNILWV